ncbi:MULTISPECIES: hypothetical protein [Rhizobium]|uniref:hypothetical protein n=1 Tax=Rhizobium TaxID=379 RepID=UPI0007E56834|nr:MULTISPECIES: hypothetical protein [Rhizobium]MBX4889336.1 hypothetical protein [Rhizobium bangladeshense]MBX4896240.1 hypothetical protein [Rhizobium bangladeshense]MBX4903232.1 hypothetical protein [Rhizobium bangladeshense]MBX4914308.1 hypothetical protein [Rhizobium bangladeshense]MBX4918649.1 hypothetical protein [Rhizobium bangladeshense]
MRLLMMLLISLLAVTGLAPAAAFAVDWTKPIQSDVKPLYPYRDLPGVKAQPDKKEEESYNCRTETVQVRRRYDEIFRSGGMPTLMYVCDRDGFVTMGRKVPLRGHYQPVR